jgi:hypothetical protein
VQRDKRGTGEGQGGAGRAERGGRWNGEGRVGG